MTPSLPDPLSLWLRASAVPVDLLHPAESDSVAGALIALWRYQERALRCVGEMLRHAQIAELAIELMLQPLRRQAELLQLAARPNPEQAAILDGALRTWLAAQLSLAQLAAAEARQAVQQGSELSVWPLWLQAFEQHQLRFLAAAEGRACFSGLCSAWGGLQLLEGSVSARSGSAADRIIRLPLRAAADKKRRVLVLAPPGCPLLALCAVSGGLLAALADRVSLSVYEWGGLEFASSVAEIEARCAQLLQREASDCTVLNLCPNLIQLPSTLASAEIGDVACLGASRVGNVLASGDWAGLGLCDDTVPGELLAVLIDALYPDWAVSSWLAGEPALELRRCCLDNLPTVSSALLQDMCVRSSDCCSAVASVDLFALLADRDLAAGF